MIKKTAPLVAVVVAAGLAVTVAQASTPTSHAVNLTGEGGGIGHPPFTHATVFAGTLGSNGAIVEKQAFKSGSQTSFGGTVTVFGPRGSYDGTITKGTEIQPPGCPPSCGGPPQGATEKVKVTGGHGLYKGATGTLKITHSLISGSPAFYKIVVKGTIKY